MVADIQLDFWCRSNTVLHHLGLFVDFAHIADVDIFVKSSLGTENARLISSCRQCKLCIYNLRRHSAHPITIHWSRVAFARLKCPHGIIDVQVVRDRHNL